jgi:hypothetical protein
MFIQSSTEGKERERTQEEILDTNVLLGKI